MSIRRVSPQEAQDLVVREAYTYLDVRSVGEFEAGHPTGSWNIPLAEPGPAGMAPNPDFLRVVSAHFAKDAKLVVGCLAGGRSARACAALAEAGFTQLVDQRAGFDAAKDPFGRVSEPGWSRAGLPVTSGVEPEHGYAALKQKS